MTELQLGMQLIIGAIVMQIIGTLIIRKMVQHRVLRQTDVRTHHRAARFVCIACPPDWDGGLDRSCSREARPAAGGCLASMPALRTSGVIVDSVAADRRADRASSRSWPRSSRNRRKRWVGCRSGSPTAGFHGFSPGLVFVVAEFALAVLGVRRRLLRGPVRRRGSWASCAPWSAYLIPELSWPAHASRQRKKQIQNGLPDALDLLIVSLEAGSRARPGDSQVLRGAGDRVPGARRTSCRWSTSRRAPASRVSRR